MLLVALDTSTAAVTVAVHDGERVLAATTTPNVRRHGELLAPALAEVLASAGAAPRDVTDVAVGVGPGPFTGLRVGIVTALAFAAATGSSVHGVCSLDALAYDVDVDGAFAVATDAGRREVYWARYADPLTRLTEPAVGRPADVAAQLDGLPVAGEGPGLHPEALPRPVAPLRPSAAALAALAVARLGSGGEGLLPPRPLYLRRPDAAPPGAPKRVLA